LASRGLADLVAVAPLPREKPPVFHSAHSLSDAELGHLRLPFGHDAMGSERMLEHVLASLNRHAVLRCPSTQTPTPNRGPRDASVAGCPASPRRFAPGEGSSSSLPV